MNSFLTGLGAGLLLGVLFAPKSGEETRHQIGSSTKDGLDYLKKQGQEIRDSAMDMVDRGKTMVNRQVGKLAGVAQETGREVYQR
jgi:gas vesicle protein